VFAQDRNLRYEWAYGNVFGIPGSNAAGKTDQELLGDGDGERVSEIKRDVLEHGARTKTRIRVGGTDGHGKTYDLYVEPNPGDASGLVGVLTRIDILGEAGE
jgi:hypothetical protein